MDNIRNYLDIIKKQTEIIINLVNHIEDEDKSTKAYIVWNNEVHQKNNKKSV